MFFCSFQHFENIHIHYVVLKLINVVKLDVENNSIVSTLSNVVNTNVEIVGLKLFNVVNFNVDIQNVVSTLIWYNLMSRRRITLTTTSRLYWKVSWGLKNLAKGVHNILELIKMKTYIFSRIPLNCCFRELSKRYW